MIEVKNYLWMVVTIPLLALVIYTLAGRRRSPQKQKKMIGVSIVSIGFGIFLVIYSLVMQSRVDKIYILFGIFWISIGIARLIYDFKKIR